MHTFAPICRCTYGACGGWILRNSWDGELSCGLCNRPARIQDGCVVMLAPVDVQDGEWPAMRLPAFTGAQRGKGRPRKEEVTG